MSTQVSSRPSLLAAGSDFLFVDNIRFITMWALFFEHTIVGAESVLPKSSWNAMAFGLCFSKFGSIAFFLASGFLLGSNLDRQSGKVYMQKRFQRVFLPWLCWFSAFCAALVYLNVHHGRTPITFGVNASHVVLGWIGFALDSPYWFVPNLLFSLCCLLLVRRLVGEKVSGVIWALASLFYAANVYLRWLPTSHRSAWLGFVFYLWLGAFCAKHFSGLKRVLSETSYTTVLAAMALLWLCGVAEYRLVAQVCPHDDPGNSIRITNQLYSLCAVFLIAKASIRLFPKSMDVRQDTFGLYLLQPLVLYCANVILAKFVHVGFFRGDPGTVFHVLLWAVWTVVVYFTALGAVKVIESIASLRWTIGLAPEKKNPRPVTAFPEPRPAGVRTAVTRIPAA